MNEKEKKIKEQRTIEATKKGFMGWSGRFGIIMKHLGHPIIAQTDGGSLDVIGVTRTELPPSLPEDDELYCDLPTIDPGMPMDDPFGYGWADKENVRRKIASTSTLGFYFDGLNRGMHLDMKYLEDTAEITVQYKGYLVFKEVAGDLQTYYPLPEWEKMIDDLYRVAKTKEDESRKKEREDRNAEALKVKESWIQRVRKNWGI